MILVSRAPLWFLSISLCFSMTLEILVLGVIHFESYKRVGSVAELLLSHIDLLMLSYFCVIQYLINLQDPYRRNPPISGRNIVVSSTSSVYQ